MWRRGTTPPPGSRRSPITPGAPGPVAVPWATFPRSSKQPLWPDSMARARVLRLLARFPPHRLPTLLPLVPSAGDTGVPVQEAPSTPAPHLAQTRAGPFFLPISAPRERRAQAGARPHHCLLRDGHAGDLVSTTHGPVSDHPPPPRGRSDRCPVPGPRAPRGSEVSGAPPTHPFPPSLAKCFAFQNDATGKEGKLFTTSRLPL